MVKERKGRRRWKGGSINARLPLEHMLKRVQSESK